jgi:pyridoxamine 5'-phosphate oxidase
VSGGVASGGVARAEAVSGEVVSGEAVPAEAVPAEAWRLLVEWLPSNDDPDRPQVTLSTVDADGAPDARTVLLSSFDRDGLSFHTDAASRKAEQLAARPLAALTVLWPGFTKQLVVRGRVETADDATLAAAYGARSPYLQQLAWLNSHEFAALPLDERRRRWAGFAAEHPAGFDRAPGWTGFVVRPTRLTFWTSAPDTASRRREWSWGPGGWAHEYRAG